VHFKPVGQELKIERLELVNNEFTEYIPKNAKQTATPPLSNRSTSPETKRSPLERSALGQVPNDIRGGFDQGEERMITPPDPEINDLGVPKILMTFLEVHLIETLL
jgi:LIM-domain binding protein